MMAVELQVAFDPGMSVGFQLSQQLGQALAAGCRRICATIGPLRPGQAALPAAGPGQLGLLLRPLDVNQQGTGLDLGADASDLPQLIAETPVCYQLGEIDPGLGRAAEGSSGRSGAAAERANLAGLGSRSAKTSAVKSSMIWRRSAADRRASLLQSWPSPRRRRQSASPQQPRQAQPRGRISVSSASRREILTRNKMNLGSIPHTNIPSAHNRPRFPTTPTQQPNCSGSVWRC